MRKLTLEDDYQIITLDDKTGKVGITDAIQQCRDALGASGYHRDNIASLMPDENELDEIISDALSSQENYLKEVAREDLDDIVEKCQDWLSLGYRSVTKDEMLNTIIKMASINHD